MARGSKEPGFYAVAIGHCPGVYQSWDDTKRQVEGYRGARHKKFPTRAEAVAFIALHNGAVLSNGNDSRSDRSAGQGHVTQRPQAPTSHSPRLFYYYAVAKGRVPGVFSSWKEAEVQVKDMYSAKYRKFSSLEEAQQYVDDYKKSQESLPSDPHPMDPSTLIAFCDGSAMENGKHGCKAGWACVFPHNPSWNRSAPLAHHPIYPPSNNRAEYRGALEAIKRANEEDPAQLRPLYICTDSELLKRSMTEWVADWKPRGWIKADGNPAKNQDLLKQLVAVQGERRIIWRKVKAHTNRTDWWSKWNAVADQMAREQTHNSVTVPALAQDCNRSRWNERVDQSRQQTHQRPEYLVAERRVRRRI